MNTASPQVIGPILAKLIDRSMVIEKGRPDFTSLKVQTNLLRADWQTKVHRTLKGHDAIWPVGNQRCRQRGYQRQRQAVKV